MSVIRVYSYLIVNRTLTWNLDIRLCFETNGTSDTNLIFPFLRSATIVLVGGDGSDRYGAFAREHDYEGQRRTTTDNDGQRRTTAGPRR